jgi:hypothetical protein
LPSLNEKLKLNTSTVQAYNVSDVLVQIEEAFDTFQDNAVKQLATRNVELTEMELFAIRGRLQAAHQLITTLRTRLGYTIEGS